MHSLMPQFSSKVCSWQSLMQRKSYPTAYLLPSNLCLKTRAVTIIPNKLVQCTMMRTAHTRSQNSGPSRRTLLCWACNGCWKSSYFSANERRWVASCHCCLSCWRRRASKTGKILNGSYVKGNEIKCLLYLVNVLDIGFRKRHLKIYLLWLLLLFESSGFQSFV